MKKRFWKRLRRLRIGYCVIGIVLVFALLVGSVIVVKYRADKRVFAGYDAGLPLDVEVLDSTETAAGTKQLIEITGLAGERIPLRVIIPANAEPPYRSVVFLYGIGQDLRFFDRIADLFGERGVLLVMPEQYNRGVRREMRGFREVFALHERSSRIVPETRRAVDYLLQRGDVDPERLDLFGASYGGIMGCAVMNHEPRFRSAVIALAGGDLPMLIGSLVDSEDMGFASPFVKTFGSWMLSAFEPLDQVAGIGIRPVLFQHLEGDELIPKESADALFEAAPEPKSRSWLKDSHTSIDEKTVEALIEEALEWLETVEPSLQD